MKIKGFNLNILVCLGILVLFFSLVSCTGSERPGGSESAEPAADAAVASTSYDDLVLLFGEWREFIKAKMSEDGVPDYTPAAIAEQRKGLEQMKRKLAAINPRGWPIPQQSDYLIVKAEMNGLEFDHRVIRPWARDPGYYAIFGQFQPTIDGTLRAPRLPIPAERIADFQKGLQAIPKILEQARVNLTEPAADLALLAINFKQRESERLQRLAENLAQHHPELVPDAQQARQAVDAYRKWLEESKDQWPQHAGVGIDNYNWYIKNVWLLPYTWDKLVAISQRELERATAAIALERHHNRKQTPMRRITNEDEYVRKFNQSQKFLLDFLKNEDILTIPDFMGLRPADSHTFRDVPDYFANIQERDPLPLMPHDFVGHGPDMTRNARDERPIRKANRLYHIEGVRAEAYATGMEEILMHLGLLDARPRSRELTYNLLAFRAARALSDLRMHSNELTFTEAFRMVVEETPDGFVPPDSPVLWGDLDLYLRQPCYGVSYLIGSVELQKMIADRAMQLGEDFNIKRFLDEFTPAGWIPMSLIRWEMTGLDDEVREFWK